jgi:adenosine deaminase
MHNHPVEFYRSFPKVELHRHLEGSLRLATLLDVAQTYHIDLPGSDGLRPLVQVVPSDPRTSQNFLSKFETLRKFYRSPKVIERITKEAIADAAADNVRYLELRFTPVALSKVDGFPLNEVMDWVIAGVNKGQDQHQVTTRLIVSVNRHESLELAAQVVRLAVDHRDSGIVGLDLAGDENGYPSSPFEPIFREAREDGLNITVHAGEWGSVENVAEAINLFKADRIGHGVRVMDDPGIVDLAGERGTTFEVCVTSNYQSGVVASVSEHPLRSMLEANLNATIHTDDPGISQITLSDEYQLVCEQLGVSLVSLRERVLAAARAAFLSQEERDSLVATLKGEFPGNI